MLLGLLRIRGVAVTFVAVVILAALSVLVYYSKPDRGGVRRCEEIFGFDSLENRGLRSRPFSKWAPFESSKFRMSVEEDKLSSLKEYFSDCGYSEWKRGGVQYGSLELEWLPTGPTYVSKKGKFILVLDPANGFLYAVVAY